MRLVLGTDESSPVVDGVGALVAAIYDAALQRIGPDDWADVGRHVGEAVASGAADVGIVFCWSGTGVSIAANKVPGVRAALCGDAVTAKAARNYNNANVLALSLRTTTPDLATEIVSAFLDNGFDPDQAGSVAKLA